MKKNIDCVDEIRKTREATYKKCDYNLRTYCEYVTKEAEKIDKENQKATGKKTAKQLRKAA